MSTLLKNTPVYSSSACGWGALKSSAKHLIRSENTIKSIKALLKAN
ncbi:MAG: hypothetical protein QNK36_18430 [Colwellia sp.]|nr:hypothetical protein [Colwellia sp.]